MPLFHKNKENLSLIKVSRFNREKELQSLVEGNLSTIFNCKFIATEFTTGPVHAGRIDTLALSEENNPVIIEYKIIESSELINQSLFYLSWIKDHKGDFQIAVDKALGKKAAQTRASGVYTFDEHLAKTDGKIKEIVLAIQGFIMELDESIEENPKKFYVAYKISQNFVCMEVQRNKISLFLKLNPDEIKDPPKNSRDVRNIGHYGTGDFEITVTSENEFEAAKQFITMALNNIGG